ncbi:MAG: tetratricopeptide repeat protein, partial [Pyrinomonadaceae bacterium]
SLLAAYDEPENLIEKNSFDLAANIASNGRSVAGKQFGNYKIIREIGRGGMGAVFLAERTDGEFEQQVALKIVRQTFADTELVKRFRRERQILANLNHPHIAKLLDGGVSEMGEPFLAMEYVEGEPLLEFAEKENLKIEDRLNLFLKICSAVAYAHRNLTVHRDIKPSNILVTKDGEPKLLDFGLAKMSDPPASAGVHNLTQTETAFRAFTPAYASPEQIHGKNITTASDVYSLGVVLYELLTGERPFNFENKSFEEVLRTIDATEPVRPSSVSSSRFKVQSPKSENEETNPHSAGPNPQSLRGDLDTIILKALRKEPELRYESVEQFAQDIERHWNDLPILARRQTFAYRASRFVRRNKIAVGSTAFVILSLITGLAFALWQANIARAERDRAQLESAKTTMISAFLHRIMLTASPSWNSPGFGRNAEITLIEVIDEAAERVKTELADQPDVLAQIQHNIGLTYIARGRYDAAQPILRSAFDTALTLHGEDHPQTVQYMRDMAAAYMLQGDYGQSDHFYQKALAIYRGRISEGKLEGNTKLGFAGSLSDYGLLHRLKGEPQTAEIHLQEAYRNAETLIGNERAVLAIVLGHLGMARDEQGDQEGAERYLRRSIQEYASLPGTQRSESGGSLLNLGIVLKEKGEYDEAESSIREGISRYRTALGGDHPYTIIALSHLSDIAALTGKLQEAEATARRSLEGAKRTFSPGHPNLAYPLMSIGRVLMLRRQPRQAESYFREAIDIRRRVMDQNFVRVAEVEGALGACLMAQGDLVNARPLLKSSFDKIQASHPDTHPRTVLAKRRLLEIIE